MNYPQAHHYAITRLRNELPPKTYYHSVDHTLDVCRAATEIANTENIQEPELTILKTAAVFHDIGFIEQYQQHEEAGCRIAREVLPQFGYLPEEIAKIVDIIMATRIPQNPEGLLGQIICDADLDYLGRDEFFEIANRLRLEKEANGVKYSTDEWIKSQIAFLEQHQYFTSSAQQSRALIKRKHLKALRALR